MLCSLTKDYNKRPKYPDLLAHCFLDDARNDRKFSMGAFITEILGHSELERKTVLQNIDMEGPTADALPNRDSGV